MHKKALSNSLKYPSIYILPQISDNSVKISRTFFLLKKKEGTYFSLKRKVGKRNFIKDELCANIDVGKENFIKDEFCANIDVGKETLIIAEHINIILRE